MELLDRQLVERVVSNAELRCHLEELQRRNGSFEAKEISEELSARVIWSKSVPSVRTSDRSPFRRNALMYVSSDS